MRTEFRLLYLCLLSLSPTLNFIAVHSFTYFSVNQRGKYDINKNNGTLKGVSIVLEEPLSVILGEISYNNTVLEHRDSLGEIAKIRLVSSVEVTRAFLY
jgi:hypothetical protein